MPYCHMVVNLLAMFVFSVPPFDKCGSTKHDGCIDRFEKVSRERPPRRGPKLRGQMSIILSVDVAF